MKLAAIEIGQDYRVKEGSYPSAGSMSFSSFYRFHVTGVKQMKLSALGRRKTWRVVGYKCRNDGSPLYGTAESHFPLSMVLEKWQDDEQREVPA